MPADSMNARSARQSPPWSRVATQRAERHLLAVLGGARVQRVERVTDQVLRAGARTRRARDLHREAAQDESAQQAVQERRCRGRPSAEAGRGRAVHEVGGALRQQRGEVVHLLAARRGRKAPVARARCGWPAGLRGPRACAPAATRRSRRGRRRARSAGGRDRCEACRRHRGSRSPARRCRLR